MNDILQTWQNAAERFNEFKKIDLAWQYILYPCLEPVIQKIESKKILDIGSGNGAFTELLSKNNNEVIGIDYSSKMVAIAEENLRGNNNVRFIAADITKGIEVENNYFDYLFCINVLVDLEDLDAAVYHMTKKVKANGCIWIAIEHPFYTAKTLRAIDPRIVQTGNTQMYFDIFRFESHFLGEKYPIIGWHRPMQEYFNSFAINNLTVKSYIEPKPSVHVKELSKFFNEPLFVLFELTKKNDYSS